MATYCIDELKLIIVKVPYGTDDEDRKNFVSAVEANAEPGWVVREMPVY